MAVSHVACTSGINLGGKVIEELIKCDSPLIYTSNKCGLSQCNKISPKGVMSTGSFS